MTGKKKNKYSGSYLTASVQTGAGRQGSAQRDNARPGNTRPAGSGPGRIYRAIAGGAIAILAVAIVGFVALGGLGSASSPGTASRPSGETVVAGTGGQWTNVTPDRLAEMMTGKDFTLLNVKTPYSGEIDGTDLYIPYTELAARASELPAAKGAKILVYCLTGRSSAAAAQTLLDLGYTNIWNLDGGMNAWRASGRSLVQRRR
jgi:phage shock protein E